MVTINIKFASFAVLAILFSISLVFAVGVSSPYWKNNPLKMLPGDSKEISFVLVEKADAETSTVTVTMKEDGGVATLLSGTSYIVKPGTTDTKIILEISVPSDAAIGTTYNVKFSVNAAPESDSGTVQLGIGYEIDFPVEIVSELPQPPVRNVTQPITPQPEQSNWILWTIIAVVIILILWWLMKSKKQV
jgi:hypothetical protein